MHNGLLIEKDSYCGPWMTEIIRSLRGFHEPQEELVFAKILDRLARSDESPAIIELGCWWSLLQPLVSSRAARLTSRRRRA